MSRTTLPSGFLLIAALAAGPTAFAQPGGVNARVGALEAAVADLEALVAQIVLAPAENLAVVRGTVLFDESVFDGAGFTVVDDTDDDGFYAVIFTPGTFSSAPTVLVQPLTTGGETAKVNGTTDLGFEVVTTAGGLAADFSFRFIAIGPQ